VWEFFAESAKNENHGSLIQAGVGSERSINSTRAGRIPGTSLDLAAVIKFAAACFACLNQLCFDLACCGISLGRRHTGN